MKNPNTAPSGDRQRAPETVPFDDDATFDDGSEFAGETTGETAP
ncbi:hypothetical protein [Aminobacter sp. MDW-2]|nr:hypothetical protein [Aminobacter sp. MDW-2]